MAQIKPLNQRSGGVARVETSSLHDRNWCKLELRHSSSLVFPSALFGFTQLHLK